MEKVYGMMYMESVDTVNAVLPRERAGQNTTPRSELSRSLVVCQSLVEQGGVSGVGKQGIQCSAKSGK